MGIEFAQLGLGIEIIALPAACRQSRTSSGNG